MLSSKNGLKPIFSSVFYDLSEKLSQKTHLERYLKKKRNLRKVAKLTVFNIFRVVSIFRPEKRVKKRQGTHILNRLEILYRMV
jgi:hypothetical protein